MLKLRRKEEAAYLNARVMKEMDTTTGRLQSNRHQIVNVSNKVRQ